MIDQQELLLTLSQYAYEPMIVYSIIVLMLTASSFGLPIPEEVTLLTAGALGYFALNPDQFPPPEAGAVPVHPWMLAIVCFFAVLLSDFLVYAIGFWGRQRVQASRRLQRYTQKAIFIRAEKMIIKHGIWMAGFFRFTPGLRFPGHMACGFMGLRWYRFGVVDGAAALLTVPTQVLLVSYYGEEILSVFKQFKIALFLLLAVGLLVFLAKKLGWFGANPKVS